MTDDILQKFIDAMTAAGFAPANANDIVADDIRRDYQLATDRAGKKKGYYVLKIEDGFGVGYFGDWRQGEPQKWHSGSGVREFTEEERAEFARKRAEEQAEKEAHRKQEQDEAAKIAIEELKKSTPASPDHPYIVKKQIVNKSLKQLGDDLLIPIMIDGKVRNRQTISPTGGKYYLKGAEKNGGYFPIVGQTDSRETIIVCEGLATGATIYEAVKMPVMVAFDRGNLIHVGKKCREKYPDAKIIFAADNDQWTFDGKHKPKDIDTDALEGDDPLWIEAREKGHLTNPGIETARQAALKVKGFIIYPEIPADSKGRETDYNDIKVNLGGIEVVREQILEAISRTSIAEPVSETADIDFVQELPPVTVYENEFEKHTSHEIDIEKEITVSEFPGLPFRVLGHNNGTYYYYPFRQMQIKSMAASSHSQAALFELASMSDWKAYYRGFGQDMSVSQIMVCAQDLLIGTASRKGVFVPSDRVRGAGVWKEANRIIVHCGDKCYVNGVETPPYMIAGYYTYVAAEKLFSYGTEQLSNKDGVAFRNICEFLDWESPLSGTLLAGWCVIAQVCSILKWRPHIWITGQAGGGKSFILDNIIMKAVGRIGLKVDGGTTEAKLREKLGRDARPLIYDEAEGEDKRTKANMDAVIMLARLASDKKTIGKVGQDDFCAQFAACFSCVYPPLRHQADETRVSVLPLKKRRQSKETRARFKELNDAITQTLTPDFPDRLLARTIGALDSLMENIATFKKAAEQSIDVARATDQLAPLLAGVYLLHSTDKISLEEATEWIKGKNWAPFVGGELESDPMKLLRTIATTLIRVPAASGIKEFSIGELISSCRYEITGVTDETVKRSLSQYGISVDHRDGRFYVANANKNLALILRDTPWAHGDKGWARALGDIDGAEKVDRRRFAAGDRQPATSLPLSLILDDDTPPPKKELPLLNEEEIPF